MRVPLPIDLTKVRLMAVAEPRLRLKADKTPDLTAGGDVVYIVSVLATSSGEGGEVLDIKVPREVKPGIRQDVTLKVTNLRLVPWARDGSSGVSYWADTAEPAGAARS